jgi:hypothetical protein
VIGAGRLAALRGALAALPRRLRERARRVTRADLVRALPGALLLGATWTLYWTLARHLTYGAPSVDEKHFIWEGWSINKGLAPYRDFSDFKPPLVFLCNALALRLFSLADQRYRFFFTLLTGASITGLVAGLMSRRVSKLLIFALVIVIHLLWLDPHYHDSSLDDAESIGMSFYLLGVGALLFESGAKRLTDFLGGALLSLAVLSKEPYVLMAVPTWATFLLLPLGDASDAGDARARMTAYAKRTLAGVGVVALWLLLYLLVERSLGDYINALRRYLPFAKTICVTYGLWKPAGFWADWAARWTHLTKSLINVGRLGVAMPLLVAAVAFGRGKGWLGLCAAWAAVAGGLYAVTLGGCFFEHYFMLGMGGLFFVMCMGLCQLAATFDSLSRRWRMFVGLSLVLAPAWQLWPRFHAERDIHYAASNPPLEAPEVVQFVKANSAPTDTVFSTGWPGIYVDSDRRPAVKEDTFFDAFLGLYPGTTDEERLAPIYEELVKSRPKVIYIEPFLEHKRVRHMNAMVLPYIRAFGYRQITDHLYLRPN